MLWNLWIHSCAICQKKIILHLICDQCDHKTRRTLEKASCNISKFDSYKLGAIWRPRHPMRHCPVTRRAPLLTWIHSSRLIYRGRSDTFYILFSKTLTSFSKWSPFERSQQLHLVSDGFRSWLCVKIICVNGFMEFWFVLQVDCYKPLVK